MMSQVKLVLPAGIKVESLPRGFLGGGSLLVVHPPLSTSGKTLLPYLSLPQTSEEVYIIWAPGALWRKPMLSSEGEAKGENSE